MQEGTLAFLQMATITAAVAAHQAAGLPYLVYLRHPTTGGVFASWASVGHLTLAEPGALIGFLGPRVYQALTGAAIPDGVQTAENLLAHGLVDAVVPPEELSGYLDRVLAALARRTGDSLRRRPRLPGVRGPDADAGLGIGRCAPAAPDRPGAADLIRTAATDCPLRLRRGRADRLLIALARVRRPPCVLAGQDRTRPLRRMARRRCGRRNAACGWPPTCGLPLVTVIDTPGGELSPAAEEDGSPARSPAACRH